MNTNSNENHKDPIPYVIVAGLSVAILIAFAIAAKRELTPTETLLLAILLSTASMMVSWLATHLYSMKNLEVTIKQATDANTENIRNYAVKAAEKVLNLSNELQRLIDLLSVAIEDAEEEDKHKDSATLLRERISAAVHNLETLKSMNDTFLSDWRGVIGDEIDRQQILETQIAKLAEELEIQRNDREILRASVVSPDDLAAIESRIADTEYQLSQKFKDLPFKVSKPKKPKKRDIVIPCPECGEGNKTSLRPRKGALKLIQCSECNSFASVRGIGDELWEIDLIPLISFEIECPLCKTSFSEAMPDYQGATKKVICPSCEIDLQLSRKHEGCKVRLHNIGAKKLPKDIIDRVKEKLPAERPWPKHIHKSVAKELGISNTMVARVIQHVIDQGLYPLPESSDKKKKG